MNETTHCNAASTLLTSVVPFAPAILIEMRLTAGAIPAYWPPEEAPLPAMMPAMNVP